MYMFCPTPRYAEMKKAEYDSSIDTNAAIEACFSAIDIANVSLVIAREAIIAEQKAAKEAEEAEKAEEAETALKIPEICAGSHLTRRCVGRLKLFDSFTTSGAEEAISVAIAVAEARKARNAREVAAVAAAEAVEAFSEATKAVDLAKEIAELKMARESTACFFDFFTT